jgi:MFS family permease
MLPGTVLTPAIRPLFAAQHGGAEGAMHAFMSVNMLAAALAAPWVGARLDRTSERRRWLRILTLADALLLALCTFPLATSLVLTLRFFEGAAHVGAATLLLTEASTRARRKQRPEIMGIAGAGIMGAVALGHTLGALLVGIDMRAPFWAGSLCALLVAALGARQLHEDETVVRGPRLAIRAVLAPIALPVLAAFVARFTVGTLVVTFALFAHRAHGLSDRAIGGLYAALTVPFALATYPAEKLARRAPRALLLALGTLVYALVLGSLGVLPQGALWPAMVAGGLASAAIFASTLGYVAERASAGAVGRAMALLNAAGCLGMLAGPAFAGVLSALLRRADDPLYAYRAVFFASAASLLLWLALAASWLVRALREERARLR